MFWDDDDRESKTRIVIECDSLREFLAQLKSRWAQCHYDTSSQDCERGGSWVLFPTYEEWDDICLKGKESPVIEKMMGTFNHELRTLRALFNYSDGDSRLYRDGLDVCGYAVDVDRFLMGEPECFWATNKPVHELIDIYVTNAIHCYVNAEEKARDAAKIAKLVYLLKLKGCNSRIYNCDSATFGACKIRIKDYRDNLDVRALLMNLLPDFHRRYNFQLFELDPNIRPGYGRTTTAMWNIWRDKFNEHTLTVDLLQADHVGITDEILQYVAKERDIKKIVAKINSLHG